MKKQSDYLSAMMMDFEFWMTIDRVRNLVSLYNQIAGQGRGRKPVNAADVLRSAVVFLHASFEQAIRELARHRLPKAAANALDSIPLIGTSQTGRAEKFLLGALVPHRAKKIEDVIKESVTDYLSHYTINNTSDLIGLLHRVEISSDPIQPYLPLLAEMLSRRHNIVHRADSARERGSGHHRAKSLSHEKVSKWIDNVDKIVKAISHEVAYPSGAP